MRLLTWNIQSGGGKRIPAICDTLLKQDADFIALTEFRMKSEMAIRNFLSPSYKYIATSHLEGNENGILIASRRPFDVIEIDLEMDSDRWVSVEIKELNIKILAVHIPGAPDNKFAKDGIGISGLKRKELFWNAIIDFAENNANTSTVILGDFNTGLRIDAEGAMFKHSHFMEELLATEYIDTWRHLNPSVKDYTYYSKQKDKATGITRDHNGFRLDYVFISPSLRKSLKAASIDHVSRQQGYSDHAMLYADIRL